VCKVCVSPNSMTPTFTETYSRGKSWTQIMKVATQTVTNHETVKFRSETAEGIWEWGQTMASAEREPITAVWGRSPQRGPGQSPWSEGRGESPLKLKHLAFEHSMEAANFPTFLKFRNTENQTFVLSCQCGHRITTPSYCYTPSRHIRSVEWNYVPQNQTPPFCRATAVL